MLMLVTNAVDGERFLLNTAFVRSFHPARNSQFPSARTVAIFQEEGASPLWLTENLNAIDCMSRGESYVELDVEELHERIKAALAAKNGSSAE